MATMFIKKPFIKKLAIIFVIVFGGLFAVSLLLNLAVTLMGQTEAIFEIGQNLEGFGDYFTLIRLSIVVCLVFYWIEIVRWYGKKSGLNLRQIFILKKIYPYVVAVILINEIFGLVF